MSYLSSHQEVVWGLVGVVLGAILAFAVNCLTQWLQRLRDRQIARMEVATNLRHWMKRVLWRVQNTRNWVGSDGQGGTLHTEIPDFRFEGALEQVSLLDRPTATKIFELIHKKDDANTEIEATAEYQDYDDAIDVFLGRSGTLFLDAWAIYDDVSARIAWRRQVFSEENREMMRSEINRLLETERQRAAANQTLFEDVTPQN